MNSLISFCLLFFVVTAKDLILKLLQFGKLKNYNSSFIGAVQMDLSKALDTINYDLLVAKLHTYGFEKNVLDLLYNYLKNNKQRINIYATFSIYTQLISVVPGPLLLTLFRMGGKRTPYPFSPCNFYKHKN